MDGQQRLTTFQLFLAAMADAPRELSLDRERHNHPLPTALLRF
jgi:uncharacterized protein with ParB-like and HNH nuclease domain